MSEMKWNDLDDERDASGKLTDLALALDALGNHGCDCGEDEPGTCLACQCEAGLRDLHTRLAAAEEIANNARARVRELKRQLKEANNGLAEEQRERDSHDQTLRALEDSIHEIHDLKRRLCVAEHGSHDLPDWSEVPSYEDATGERVIGRVCRRDCSYYEDFPTEKQRKCPTCRGRGGVSCGHNERVIGGALKGGDEG